MIRKDPQVGLGEGYSDIFILSSDHFPVQNFEFSGGGGGGVGVGVKNIILEGMMKLWTLQNLTIKGGGGHLFC